MREKHDLKKDNYIILLFPFLPPNPATYPSPNLFQIHELFSFNCYINLCVCMCVYLSKFHRTIKTLNYNLKRFIFNIFVCACLCEGTDM